MATLPEWWPQTTGTEAPAAGAGLWAQLKTALDVSQSRSARAEGVVVKEMCDGSGRHFILKNPRTHTYVRLSPPEYWVWQRLDGRQTVQQLVIAYFLEHQAFAFGAIVGMLDLLRAQNMLSEPPGDLYGQIGRSLQERTLIHKLTWPVRAVFTRAWAIRGLDGYLTRIYRSGAWILFTRPAQIVFLVISAAGLVLFTLLLNDPRFKVLGADLASGALRLGLLSYVPLVIHEFGHAITAKHVGCEVYRGGVLLYYGMPAAFVDTTDVWMQDKRARLAVTWAGPYTGFIIGGLCAGVLYFWPDIQGGRLLLQLAFVSILTSVINLIPMLKLDGYYLLSDALDMPRLREHSLEFLQGRFIPKVLRREAWTRQELIFVGFGIVSAISSLYFAYLGIAFWNQQASHSWAQLVSRQGGVISLITNVLIVLLAASSIIFGVYQAYRHGHRLVDWARRVHLLATPARAALILALGAGALTFGPDFIFPNLPVWLIAAAGVIAFAGAARLALTTLAAMRGSAYANLWLMLAAGLSVAGLAQALGGVPGLVRASHALDAIGLTLAVIAIIIGARLLAGLRGSWRAVSAGLGGLGLLAWAAAWLGASSALAPKAHLYAGLLLAGGLLHWWMRPRPATESAPRLTEAQMATTPERLAEAFQWLAGTILREMAADYGRGAKRRVEDGFGRIATARGWEVRIDSRWPAERRSDPAATASDFGGMLALAVEALLDEAAHVAGQPFARRALAHGYDGLNWEQQELAGDYLLRYTRWATGLTEALAGRRDETAALLQAAPIFVTLTAEEIAGVGRALRPRYFVPGEAIIHQGEAGEEFFILRQGRVEVLQRDAGGATRKVNELTRGDYFGETSLLTGERRNATIRALTPVEALTLTRRDFNRLLRDDFAAHNKIETAVRRVGWLRQIPIFAEFEGFELRLMATRLESLTAAAGQTIFRQDQPADKFYIVESGEVIVSQLTPDGVETERARLGPGEYFGEIALLMAVPRTATVIATRATTLLTLDAEKFNELLWESQGLKRALERAASRRVLSNTEWRRRLTADTLTKKGG